MNSNGKIATLEIKTMCIDEVLYMIAGGGSAYS